jgi:hypothetical protein
MIDYTRTRTALFSEGPAKVKIIKVKTIKRRDPEEWTKKVDTVVIELAVFHSDGKKDFYEDSIPITHTFGWRIDELRKALGEILPDDDDPARANWNEQTAIDQVAFVWFTVWKSEKKTGNNIQYLLPDDGAELFREAPKTEEVSA